VPSRCVGAVSLSERVPEGKLSMVFEWLLAEDLFWREKVF